MVEGRGGRGVLLFPCETRGALVWGRWTSVSCKRVRGWRARGREKGGQSVLR